MQRSAVVYRLDKRDLETKVKQIENSLKPFIDQVVTPDPNFSSQISKGKSKNAHSLVNILAESISNFLECANGLCIDYPDVKDDLNQEINKIRDVSQSLLSSAKEFAIEPFSTQKRVYMGSQARILLNSVARLMAIADMIDSLTAHSLIDSMFRFLGAMKMAKSEKEFLAHFRAYGENLRDLLNISPKFIQSLTDNDMKNEFALVLGQLTKQSLFLYTSSKTLIKHPESIQAISLHDQVYKEAFDALNKINQIFMNEYVIDASQANKKSPDLLENLKVLEKHVENMKPIDHIELKQKNNLEIQLDNILKNIQSFTSSNLIESERNDRIGEECSSIRKALQDLFDSYSDNKTNMNPKLVEKHQQEFIRKNKSLRRQLRKALIEQLIVLSNSPLEDLITVAKLGQHDQLKERIVEFRLYANRLSELSRLACALASSTNSSQAHQESIQMVQIARKNMEALVSYVIHAAEILCTFGMQSREAWENMQVIRSRWLNQVDLLQLAIDDITSINDFMAIYEYHIHTDLNKCIGSLYAQSVVELNSNANQAIRKCLRVCDMIDSEMNNYERCEYTSQVSELVSILRNQNLVLYSKAVDFATDALNSRPIRDANENELIDSSRLIYDSVRDLRNALLLIPQQDGDNEFELDDEYWSPLNVNKGPNQTTSTTSTTWQTTKSEQQIDPVYKTTEFGSDEMEEALTANESHLTQEQRDKLNAELTSLRNEKNNFDREVLKWDERSNEIVVLSKQMCVIMMDMIKYTRGIGPLKSTMDIIQAAKQITEIGLKLEKLCRKLADECPESQSKKELLDYLGALPLFCNQLTICTKVQENIIDPNSATSLIISSKNLMNKVISVVKSSYVASTKYASKTDTKKPIVQWKMKPPELKPLVTKPKPNDRPGLIRKASNKSKFSPIKALAEFQI